MKAKNNFQSWLIDEGYYRAEGSLVWLKNEMKVSGAELSIKLNEWKALNAKNKNQ